MLSAEIVTLKTRKHNTPYPGVQPGLEASSNPPQTGGPKGQQNVLNEKKKKLME